ncbi:MAG TPA: Rrf2 family transcriptional regulator [Bordetella sp.]
MQLNHFTDFGLRAMMYLTQCQGREKRVTIPEIAERFRISRNHLMKVVHFLSQSGWIVATRGKGGGLELARPPEHYKLGQMVHGLERQGSLTDCSDPSCELHGLCLLADVLEDELRAFYASLDRHTLADLVREPTRTAIIRLHRAAA